MPMLSNIVGFSLFGLAARLGQLGIQQRNLFSNPGGHLIAMGVFGYAGYWIDVWEIRSGELLAERKLQIKEGRQRLLRERTREAAVASSEMGA